MYRTTATNVVTIDDMNEILKLFKKMRMNNKKTKPTNSSATHPHQHPKTIPSPNSHKTTAHTVQSLKNSPQIELDQQTKDLKKILKLFKKHVKKQIIFKKTKFVI